jgi:heme A synthase
VVLGLLSMFGLLSVSDLIGLGNLRRSIFLVVFSLLVGALALWLGTSAVVRSRRAAAGRPRGGVSAIILGGIGVLFSALLLITFAVLWKQLSAYSQCMQSANTLVAQHDCQDQLSRSVSTETGKLRSSG